MTFIKHIFLRYRQYYKKKNMYKKSSCFRILFLCLAVHSGGFGQEQNIREGSFVADEKAIIKEKLSLYKNLDKHKYLTLVPSIEYNSAFRSLMIGFNTQSISNFLQLKHRNKIHLAQLENQLLSSLDSKIEKLKIEIIDFDNKKESILNAIIVFEIDKKLLEINIGKYNNTIIPTEVFLNKKKEYLLKVNSLKNKIHDLEKLAIKIEEKTKNNCFSADVNNIKETFNSKIKSEPLADSLDIFFNSKK